MLVNTKRIKFGVTDLVLVCLSALFFIGILTWFKPCPPMESGAYMVCHWAGQAVAGVAGVMLVLSIAHMFLPSGGIKQGIAVSLVALCVLAMILPDGLIDLKCMSSMRCHTIMRPWTIVFSVLLLLSSLADFIYYIKKR